MVDVLKYLLVAQPIAQYKKKDKYCMPLGIAYINGALRYAGFDVDGINMMFTDGDPYEALREKLLLGNYDVLLCGGLSAEYKILKRIFDIAREVSKKIIIIGGGGGFSASPIIFSQITGVDYAVIGEGEITDVELVTALENNTDISVIDGIVYKDSHGIYKQTKPRLPIRDLDSIPFPSYEGLGIEEYLENQLVDGWYNYFTYYSDDPRLMPMMMSRSCPYMCSFCFHPIGRGYRSRGLDNFFKELDMWIEKYNINGIALVDECFSMEPQKVIEFCKRIKPYNISWACQMRAEIYDYELMKIMKDSGCIGACFGIESMSQSVLNNMQKHLSQTTIEKALSVAYECEVGITGNLLFGAENETFETVLESVKWNRKHSIQTNHQPINAFIYIQTYPGSRYYENAVKQGRIKNEADYIKKGQWIINNTNLSEHDFDLLSEVMRLLQHEVRCPGELIRLWEQPDGRTSMTFVCPHCGAKQTYHNMNRSHLKEDRIRNIGCRNCNGMADYLMKPDLYPYDHYYTIDWLLNHIHLRCNMICDDAIIETTRKKIVVGILGAGYISEKLIEHIKQNEYGINIKWVFPHKKKCVLNDLSLIIDDIKTADIPEIIIDADLVHPQWVKKIMTEDRFKNTVLIDVERIIRKELRKTEQFVEN